MFLDPDMAILSCDANLSNIGASQSQRRSCAFLIRNHFEPCSIAEGIPKELLLKQRIEATGRLVFSGSVGHLPRTIDGSYRII